mgnify:CR=1 FL=1|jgi:hypothetical protein
MSKVNQTTHKEAGKSGLAGVLRGSFQAGLGVAESMHQLAVEIPLNMLPGVGVSEETATELKVKHRNLLRGMYGSIDSLTTKAMDFGADAAERMTDEVKKLAADVNKAAKDNKVVAKVEAEVK